MTKIITCCELRYLTLALLEAMVRTLQIELGAHRARFARARRCAHQPRKRPPYHGGAAHPAAEAVSASARVSPQSAVY